MNPYIYVLSVNGLLFFISLIFFFFPPKKINNFYGYRTHRSMVNDDVWQFANSFFNKNFVIYAGIGFAAALAMTYFFPELMTSWFPMAFLFFTLGICIYATEKTLNLHFDKEGNRKTKK